MPEASVFPDNIWMRGSLSNAGRHSYGFMLSTYSEKCSAREEYKCYNIKGSFVQRCVWRKLYYP
jgi:hypothetical protein